MSGSFAPEAAALAEFPELQHLIDLRDAGWVFLPTSIDGHLVQLQAVRTWPEGWADAVHIRYVTDAAGLRTNYTGEVTWQREGTLSEVINGLIALPAPSDRLAPRLVIARGPQLWTRQSGP
jgi:hypothetical protein